MEIEWYTAERAHLRSLIALAEDSPERLDASIDQGRMLVARDGGEIVGCLQLVETGSQEEIELRTIAVAEGRQRQGIGRALVAHAVRDSRERAVRTMLVSTAAADVGNLAFYQRLGFRMLCIERDAFTAADGYSDGLTIEGIPLRDRVWLSLELRQAA
jgi:ribosomal protein S18 acetylase RimI-like enzyme